MCWIGAGGWVLREMTDRERREFLLYGTRTGKLATVREDGRPHVAPIWFLLDGVTDGEAGGASLVFMTGGDTVKGRNILRDGRVAVSVDEETPPFAFVLLEGRAEVSGDPADLRYWATRIAARYMGEDLAESYGERNSVPGELLVRVTPEKIIAETGVAD